MNPESPTLIETATGCFLHDIGKLLQRAGGTVSNLPQEVRSLEPTVLPVWDGRYTHKHALWTEMFFHELSNLFPGTMNSARIRDVAVFHHKPDSPFSEICAQADQLASGMDRKQKDIEAENPDVPANWMAFIKTPLDSCYNSVQLDLGKPSLHLIPLAPLLPGRGLMPLKAVNAEQYPQLYRKQWEQMKGDLTALGKSNLGDEVFIEALISVSERYLSTVPSSTKDQPDISLYDHSRATAAVGAALYLYHKAHDSLEDRAAIRDKTAQKFRFIAGDLSGIQASLFRLANQQVRGVNKILRARSFLIGMILEGALLECRHRLGLPPYSVLQNAGGRFVLLAPATSRIDESIKALQAQIDQWLWERYTGEVAVNLAASPAFAGKDLLLDRFKSTMSLAEFALAEAKMHAFSQIGEPVHRRAYPHGPCTACNARPGEVRRGESGEDSYYRCRGCDDEERLGRALPRIECVGWTRKPTDERASIRLFGDLVLTWYESGPFSATGFDSLFKIYSPVAGQSGLPVANRFLANYVPLLREEEGAERRYRNLSVEAKETRPGDPKTFEHLAADALEPDPENVDNLLGEPLLAALKADVDRLGQIFGGGIANPSLGRVAAVSRFTDFFFTGHMMSLLRSSFPSTYTVYAGGDDLLLIGPWRQMIALAGRLREEFREWTGDNPNITLSAAIELMKVSHPVNRVVRQAEERLKAAKDSGRNQISIISEEPLGWPQLAKQLEQADDLDRLMKGGKLSQAFVYRLLYFAEQKKAAEQGKSLEAANWRARWSYQVARHLNRKDPEGLRIIKLLNGLLGLDQGMTRMGSPESPRPAVTIALYRNRSGKEKR